MGNGWIAYVGHMLFPWGQAASRRVYGNAMSMVSAGHNVVVASGSDQSQNITCLEKHDNGKNLSHIGLGACSKGNESPWGKALRLLFESSLRTINWLESQPTKPTHIVLYGGYSPYMLRLIPWCRRNNVTLVADIVEWHDPQQLPGGKFGLSSLNYAVAMRYLFPKCDGIISISSYLSDYYRQCGCPVVQIPPTLDMSKVASPEIVQHPVSKPLTLVYAGDPRKKDLLRPIIDGMKLAAPDADRVRLLVLGPTEEQVLATCTDGAPLPKSVQLLGRVPQNQVAGILRRADFSVLLRPQMRFANAGFPTKFVESMANGVPVIANCTSDIGTYLHDGVEGFVCKDHSEVAFSEALKKALSLEPESLVKMRMAAYSQAQKSFDYRAYVEPLAAFLDDVRK